MKLRTIGLWCGAFLLALCATVIMSPSVHAAPDSSAAFDPILALTGKTPSGSLGLPGEPILWLITVTNNGAASGTNVVISDLLPGELRVDRAETPLGEVAISEQMVVFTIPEINPGESVQMQINTTVLQSPHNGMVINQAMLAATGPEGPITRKKIAQIYLPATVPDSGYQPEMDTQTDFPGEGEPSTLQIGLAGLALITLAAGIVWYRGRRKWQSLI